MSTRFDLVVVGGGMVGAALALGAARRGFRVALVERRTPALDWPPDSHDLRVSALGRAARRLLENLGAWPAARATPYERMRVWAHDGPGVTFDAADLGEPDLGHIVENREIVAALWRALAAHERVEPVPGREPAALEAEGLRLDDGRLLAAPLVVGADGAHSRIRMLAGIGQETRDYDQHALVATVRPEGGHGDTAWQRFLPEGPLALLPLRDGLFSIVWSISPQRAAELAECPPAAFERRLTAASQRVRGRLTLVDPVRAVFPLRRQHARRYARSGVALVGDAAHVIHPLAGQGVNLGLLDAGMLLDVVEAARRAGRSPGAEAVLARYERARRGHNLAVQAAMDGFLHLFAGGDPLRRLIRGVGLGLVDRAAPLRRLFESAALGAGVELPTLARPPSHCSDATG